MLAAGMAEMGVVGGDGRGGGVDGIAPETGWAAGVGGGGAGAAGEGVGGAAAAAAGTAALAAPPRLRNGLNLFLNVKFSGSIIVTCTHNEEFSSGLNSSTITNAQLSNDPTARGFNRDRCFVRFNMAYFFIFLDCITNSYRKQKYSMKNTIRSTGASLSS
jgi:hypothetical protein